MNEPSSKSEILELIQGERAALENVLEQLSDEQMTRPGLEDDRSVKDILAHITDWERRMVGWIEESLRGETPQRPAPGMDWDDLDGLNEQIYLANKDKPLSAVLSDSRAAHQQSLKTVEALSEEDLLDPQRFTWRKGDPMWHMVAANTWWHYKEHSQQIRDWLTKAER